MEDLRYQDMIYTCETPNKVADCIDSVRKSYPEMQSFFIRYKSRESDYLDITSISNKCNVFISFQAGESVELGKILAFYKVTKMASVSSE